MLGADETAVDLLRTPEAEAASCAAVSPEHAPAPPAGRSGEEGAVVGRRAAHCGDRDNVKWQRCLDGDEVKAGAIEQTNEKLRVEDVVVDRAILDVVASSLFEGLPG